MKFIGDRRFSELVGRKTYWSKFKKERKERKQRQRFLRTFSLKWSRKTGYPNRDMGAR